MNKFILHIKLTENYEFGLEITIIHWDQNYLSCPNKEKNSYNYHTYKGFIMFSAGEGKISCTNIFRLPSLNELKPNHKLYHNFLNDKDRYNYLKQLFYCLQDWGLKLNELNKHNEPLYNKKIIVNDSYWIM